MTVDARIIKIEESDDAETGNVRFRTYYELLPPTGEVLIDDAVLELPVDGGDLLENITGRRDIHLV